MVKFRIPMLDKLLIAVGKMAGGLAALGLMLYWLVTVKSVVLSLAFVVVLIVMAAIVATNESRQPRGRVLLPLLAGSALSVVVISLWFLFFVMGQKNPFEVSQLIPVCGVIAAAVALTNGKALSAYYSGLYAHHQLYDYMIGNGATHTEATAHFQRRALERAMMPLLKCMGNLVVPLGCLMAWVLIMMGVAPLQAVLFEGLMLIAMLSASVLSLIIAILLGRHYSFDKYEQLKKKK
jgi:putative ABC transport system permease protein